jgi:hypothetical protein
MGMFPPSTQQMSPDSGRPQHARCGMHVSDIQAFQISVAEALGDCDWKPTGSDCTVGGCRQREGIPVQRRVPGTPLTAEGGWIGLVNTMTLRCFDIVPVCVDVQGQECTVC